MTSGAACTHRRIFLIITLSPELHPHLMVILIILQNPDGCEIKFKTHTEHREGSAWAWEDTSVLRSVAASSESTRRQAAPWAPPLEPRPPPTVSAAMAGRVLGSCSLWGQSGRTGLRGGGGVLGSSPEWRAGAPWDWQWASESARMAPP